MACQANSRVFIIGRVAITIRMMTSRYTNDLRSTDHLWMEPHGRVTSGSLHKASIMRSFGAFFVA